MDEQTVQYGAQLLFVADLEAVPGMHPPRAPVAGHKFQHQRPVAGKIEDGRAQILELAAT